MIRMQTKSMSLSFFCPRSLPCSLFVSGLLPFPSFLSLSFFSLSLSFYDYLWISKQGFDEDALLSSLPEMFQEEIALFLRGDYMERIPFLSFLDLSTKALIARKLRTVIVPPDEFIVQEGGKPKIRTLSD